MFWRGSDERESEAGEQASIGSDVPICLSVPSGYHLARFCYCEDPV